MIHHQTVGLFRGPQRTLSTPLPADACVQRVREDVGESMRAFFGWRPLKQHPVVWRKLRSNAMLFVVDGAGRNQWVFYMHLTKRSDKTIITGCYRMPTAMWVLFGLVLCYSLYLVTGSFLAVPVFDFGRPPGWRVIPLRQAVVFGSLLPVISFGMYALMNRIHRSKLRKEEHTILVAVKHLLDAEEIERPKQ